MTVLDAAGLRALQKPIKDRYRANPASALTPSRAVARVDSEGIAATVEGWAGNVTAGLHRAAGGDDSLACSADLLLEAVAACAGVTLKSVATAMGVQLRDTEVVVEGHWDARGTLGVDRQVPVGLTDVTITFRFTSDADDATEERLVRLAERYCVVAQTLRTPPPITIQKAAAAQPTE